MSLENTQSEIGYTGTGNVNLYAIPFPVLEKSHLVVECLDDAGGAVSWEAGRDYQVATTRDAYNELYPSGVKTTRPLPVNWRLIIRRVLPLTQESVMHNQGPNSPRVVERGLDKLTMIAQQLDASVRVAAGRTDAVDREVGRLAERVDGFGRDANALAGRADAVERDLGALAERTDALERDVGEVPGRLAAVEGDVGLLAVRMEAVDRGIGELPERVAAVERDMGDLAERVANSDRDAGELPGRIAAVEQGMGALANRTDAFERDLGMLSERVAAVDGELPERVAAVERDMGDLAERVANVDRDAGELPGRIAAVEQEVGQLAGRVGVIETGLSRLRTMLAGDRVYYVSQQGDDGNDGLSEAKAFRSIGRFMGEIATLDGRGNQLILNIGPGTWEENNYGSVFQFTAANTLGFSQVKIYGAGMGQTVLRGGPGAFGLSTRAPGTPIYLENVKLENVEIAILAENYAVVRLGQIDFGQVNNSHINVLQARLDFFANYRISGGATGYYHILASQGSWVECVHKTVAIANTPRFGACFALCDRNSALNIYSNQYQGSATGKRFEVRDMALLHTYGAGQNYLPGDAAGSVDGTSHYV